MDKFKMFKTRFEDVPCVLNPVQTSALKTILELTPARKRPNIALIFAGISYNQWARLADIHEMRVYRLSVEEHRHNQRLYYEDAARLSKVLGVDDRILFEHWNYRHDPTE